MDTFKYVLDMRSSLNGYTRLSCLHQALLPKQPKNKCQTAV